MGSCRNRWHWLTRSTLFPWFLGLVPRYLGHLFDIPSVRVCSRVWGNIVCRGTWVNGRWGGYRGLLLIALHLTRGGRFSHWTQSLLICYSGLSVCWRDPLSLPADVGITAAPPHLPGIYMSSGDLNLGSYACAADALGTDPSPQPRFIIGCTLFPCFFFFSKM